MSLRVRCGLRFEVYLLLAEAQQIAQTEIWPTIQLPPGTTLLLKAERISRVRIAFAYSGSYPCNPPNKSYTLTPSCFIRGSRHWGQHNNPAAQISTHTNHYHTYHGNISCTIGVNNIRLGVPLHHILTITQLRTVGSIKAISLQSLAGDFAVAKVDCFPRVGDTAAGLFV